MERLPAAHFPQADRPEELLALARHIVRHGLDNWSGTFISERHRAYYLHGLRLLGALGDDRRPTLLLHALAAEAGPARAAFTEAFRATEVCRTWLRWQGTEAVEQLDLSRTQEFVIEVGDLSPSTAIRRAKSLRSWLSWIQHGEPQLVLPLFADTPVGPVWPSPDRFPHNEAGHQVGQILAQDFAHDDILVVVGYASMDEVIRTLSSRADHAELTSRILFGNEPFANFREVVRPSRGRLSAEVRDYWLERGISVRLCADILRAREAVLAAA